MWWILIGPAALVIIAVIARPRKRNSVWEDAQDDD